MFIHVFPTSSGKIKSDVELNLGLKLSGTSFSIEKFQFVDCVEVYKKFNESVKNMLFILGSHVDVGEFLYPLKLYLTVYYKCVLSLRLLKSITMINRSIEKLFKRALLTANWNFFSVFNVTFSVCFQLSNSIIKLLD